MKKYNLAKREGAYQKAPSGPRRGHIGRAWIGEGDPEQGYLGAKAEKDWDYSGFFSFFSFFFPRHSGCLRCSSLC